MYRNTLSALPLLLALSPLTQAQIVAEPPFVGSIGEDFDSLSVTGLSECLDIAPGNACGLPGSLSLGLVTNVIDGASGCNLQPFSGNHVLLKIDGSVPVLGSDELLLTFDQPLRRFGGRFADSATSPVPTVFTFIDAQGVELDSQTVTLSSGCSWEWFGWSAAPGSEFQSVRIVHSGSASTGLLLDSLEFDADGGSGLGINYCTATPNSAGGEAILSATGSTSVAQNQLLLSASPVPAQPGLFYYGPQQALLPFGNGFRCVGGTVARLDVIAGSGGSLSQAVDLTSPPTPATQITGGSTWFFQAWFRDPAGGGAGFNLSDGLELTFLP